MISLLVVNFRSAALAAEAVRTARAACSSPLQVVIVDNSCDGREADALEASADTLIVSKTNRGYAGAINEGRRACGGDTIVISNPDVLFAPRSIDLLAGALDARTAVAGPALFWDDAHRWHLPPGDLLTAREKLDQVLASRSAKWRAQRDERRFAARVRFWSLQQPTEVRMLSGAVMAVRARDFDTLEGFDERFPLYFEETDFLRRVREHRKRIVYVPEAKVRHVYNQSASQTAEVAAARYAESEWKYLEKWNGPWLARVMKGAERRTGFSPSPHGGGRLKPALHSADVITEASPLASFDTAAGHFGYAEDVPAEVKASLRGAPLYLRYKIRP
ncbi:MAG TPA: glycosyltransferase family 2 protein [Thermoanaerobaculia bacterium]|jgi:GT2 family glycosyltransferase|nr:glycosyltransferase family 2 protein [Thermoanaerobaculia bacterium]